jgi:anti-sigma factor RsiW
MLHWRARRLLPRLLDEEELSDELRLDVEVHAASCARCRRVQREFELSERLLQGMPIAFGPLEFDPNTYARLVALNRWSSEPSYPHRDRYNAPILALASAVAIVLMAATMSHWSPTLLSIADPITIASGHTDSAYISPTWSYGRF